MIDRDQPILLVWQVPSAVEFVSAESTAVGIFPQEYDYAMNPLEPFQVSKGRVMVVSEKAKFSQGYEPLKNKDLWLDFAHLGSDEESIRSFALKYGMLTITGLAWDTGYEPVNEFETGEHISFWIEESKRMREVFYRWQAERMLDLNAAFELQKPYGIVDYQWYVKNRSSEDIITGLAISIDEKLGHVTPRISFSSRGTHIQFQPRTLLAGLWFQFAQTMTSNIEFRSCSQCAKWFAASGRGVHRDRELCSDACKSRAYRQRKKAQALTASPSSDTPVSHPRSDTAE